jgi:hypothetical protein
LLDYFLKHFRRSFREGDGAAVPIAFAASFHFASLSFAGAANVISLEIIHKYHIASLLHSFAVVLLD